MKTIRLNSNNHPSVKELMFLLTEEYNKIINNAEKLDEMYWDIEKNDLTEDNLSEVAILVGTLNNEMKKLFHLEEELLYKEMDHTAPNHSAISVFRQENRNILEACESTRKIIMQNDKHSDKNLLQASIIALSDIIIRSGIKKKKALLNEVKEVLTDEKIGYIKQKITGELEFLTS